MGGAELWCRAEWPAPHANTWGGALIWIVDQRRCNPPPPKAPILLWPHEKGLWRSQTAVSQQQPGTTKLRFRVTGTLRLSKGAINLDGDAQFPEKKKNTLHNPN